MLKSPDVLLEKSGQHLGRGLLILSEDCNLLKLKDPNAAHTLILEYEDLLKDQYDLKGRKLSLKARAVAVFRADPALLEHWKTCKSFEMRVRSTSDSVKKEATKEELEEALRMSATFSFTDSGSDPFADDMGVPSQPFQDPQIITFELSNNSSVSLQSTSSSGSAAALLRSPVVTDASNQEYFTAAAAGVPADSFVIPFTGWRAPGEDILHCQVGDAASAP
ncbi:hypothetical protein OE88DRAFT_1806426 [Heliocybe sulcata]|uniref:Uncharacterized protein n=1 Tax=Heliocybe sulcata TaxID=5364 RepID=A0A5C3N9H8_9AGAM|nr:hypothetical protein OE88DRAFT_1806426 [Heliocybe sulcata]